MNEDVACIRLYYADGSTVLTAPEGAMGYLIEGISSDPIGVEFIDTFDNPIIRVDIGDENTVCLVEMEGKPVWTDEGGWLRDKAGPT